MAKITINVRVNQIFYTIFYLKLTITRDFQKVEWGKLYNYLIYYSKFTIYLQNMVKTSINGGCYINVYDIFT
jgi:hypothetical protein